jgi:hypothetical protein
MKMRLLIDSGSSSIVKIKLKHWWSSIPPITTKRKITSHLNSTEFTEYYHLSSEINWINRILSPLIGTQRKSLNTITSHLNSTEFTEYYHLSSEFTKYINNHGIWRWISRSWLGTSTNITSLLTTYINNIRTIIPMRTWKKYSFLFNLLNSR